MRLRKTMKELRIANLEIAKLCDNIMMYLKKQSVKIYLAQDKVFL